jgi:endonuclease YncB( thermonuclease family)
MQLTPEKSQINRQSWISKAFTAASKTWLRNRCTKPKLSKATWGATRRRERTLLRSFALKGIGLASKRILAILEMDRIQ